LIVDEDDEFAAAGEEIDGSGGGAGEGLMTVKGVWGGGLMTVVKLRTPMPPFHIFLESKSIFCKSCPYIIIPPDHNVILVKYVLITF